MDDMYVKRNIMCIDLKSFFASCECVERGLDPFKVPLVVANKKQGNGAITLAVTPALKKQGIPGRVRLYDIPKNIKYEIVPPRMKLYIEKSKQVVGIYLDYVAPEDLHIYSIDECFLDVTDYLKLYKKTDYELAEEILKTVEEKIGLTATCGIGPNLLLAKVAMDTEAKKYKNGIAKWTYDDVPEKLWSITPLSKMWGIGPRMEKKLNNLNIYTVGELANYDKNILKDKFGVMGQELWDHANGIDLSKISDFKNKKYDILVSTTVVEVGVDVPNATLMLIENAERFGLSQLHQLRGRVGRNDLQSYCILHTSTKSQETKERLNIMTQTNDGFVIAEKDLQLRGPGEFLGTRQSGLPDLIISDIVRDAKILEMARNEAIDFVKTNNIENYPILKEATSLQLFSSLDI